ncbi:MAG: glycosyltransferase [Bacteroidia bacterium]
MNSIIDQAPQVSEAYDMNTADAHAYMGKVEQWLSTQNKGIDECISDASLLGDKALALGTALKFIKSKQIILGLKEKVNVSLINPVYKEIGRLKRREEHPHGENSLRTKIACLDYFHSINPLFNGRVIVVDDGCPDGSGAFAKQILSEYPDSPHHVYFLEEAIVAQDPDTPEGITEKSGSNRSVKGGAVLFGMKKALQSSYEGLHIIIDNDADLSVHPMQVGLLLEDIVNGNAKVVAGSRREKDSIALIGGSRNSRGNLFIQIWKHFLPELAKHITDTNRAFKAFESEALREILPLIKIYTFPYQIEVLQATLSLGIPLVKKGIAYIDSEAASTQSGDNITETYLNQIHQIMDISQRYKTIDDSDPLFAFFNSISEEDWMRIESNPPDKLLDLVNL